MQYSPHQYIPTLFSFFGRSPSGRKGLILLRLAFHQSFLQAFRTCRKDLVNAAYIFNFGQKMQHISVGTPKSFSFLGGAPFSRRGLIRLRLALHQSFLQYFRTCRKDWWMRDTFLISDKMQYYSLVSIFLPGGTFFFIFGRSPFGRRGLISLRLAWL